MTNKLANLALVAVTTGLGLTMVQVSPAQAADFAYFTFSFDSVYGELSFNNTLLTGIGIETASLSQLSSQSGFNFFADPYYLTPPFSSFRTDHPEYYAFLLSEGNPVFTFDSGYLAGIEFDASLNIDDRELSGIDPSNPGEYLGFAGGSNLSLLGDSYEASLSGVGFFVSTKSYNGTHELIVVDTQNSDSGLISFYTNDPIEAVPEPLTIIGTGTALGFGTFFKKNTGQKTEKIKV